MMTFQMSTCPSGVRRVMLDSTEDLEVGHFHHIHHDADGMVLVQVYGVNGSQIQFPGSGPAIRQTPGCVSIAKVHETFYPLTVVMVG